jgi:predicted RNA-binding Zn-ribbon protein involved in translation (DUF1610 family)
LAKPLAIERLNTCIEEGSIYRFEGCGHSVAMRPNIADWSGREDVSTLYCPLCGAVHEILAAAWDEEPVHLNDPSRE